MKSDFFRHMCLFVGGGVYVDADEVCQRPVEIPASVELVVRFRRAASASL
jgi:mannosyltransferase OCH1-like enzyme